MGMGLSLNANSVGERIVVALAVVALIAEMLSDNPCVAPPRAEPIAAEDCASACFPKPIRRWEAWACECEAGQGVVP